MYFPQTMHFYFNIDKMIKNTLKRGMKNKTICCIFILAGCFFI